MKILFAGLGGIGQRHLRNLRALLGDSAEFIAYRVRGLSQVLTPTMGVEAGNLQERFGIRAVDTLESALALQPDLAMVCNPTALHMSVAHAAARAGCHLFIEKPLSDSLDSVEELAREVESRKLVGFVGYQMRFHPCLLRANELLKKNAIGRIIAVRAENGEYLPGYHPYEDYRQSYAARADLGGGVVLTQIHELDYLLWLFGFPRKLFAVGGHLSQLEINVEDTASLLMDCEIDGRAVPIHVHEDYVQRRPVRTCQIIGEAGSILIDLRAPSITMWNDAGSEIERLTFAGFDRNQLFVDEMKHLLACMAGEEKPVVTIRDAARSLQMALAAKESMKSGKVIELADAAGH